MTKKAIILLAEGFEEVEAITPIDYLRRAGVEVTMAAIGKNSIVKSARGIQVIADTCLVKPGEEGKIPASAGEIFLSGATSADFPGWDAVIVPGGLPGSDNLAASMEAREFLLKMDKAGKLICAICAAPARVLAPLGLLNGKKFTCYPGEEGKVSGADWKEDRVVMDGNIITSRGAGTAGEFACAIIDALLGAGEGKKIADKVLLV